MHLVGLVVESQLTMPGPEALSDISGQPAAGQGVGVGVKIGVGQPSEGQGVSVLVAVGVIVAVEVFVDVGQPAAGQGVAVGPGTHVISNASAKSRVLTVVSPSKSSSNLATVLSSTG